MSNKLNDRIKQIFVFTGDQKVLKHLVFSDDWQTAKEIQKDTVLSKAAVNIALNNLYKSDLVERDQKGKTYLYRANADYPIASALKQYKLLNNLVEILPLVQKIIPLSQKIILFGSASRGENYSKSDIDLMAVTHNSEQVKVKAMSKKLFLNKKVQIITHSPNSLLKLEKSDPIFYQEIESGVVLWEKEEHYAE